MSDSEDFDDVESEEDEYLDDDEPKKKPTKDKASPKPKKEKGETKPKKPAAKRGKKDEPVVKNKISELLNATPEKRKKEDEDDSPKKRPKKEKNIEEKYKKLDHIEHVLTRPDMYIGSANAEPEKMWVYENGGMVYKKINYVPGLLKIFDEILVNAADNKQRDPTMANVKVEISAEENLISVFNDGEGIPVEMHKEHNMYIPELIFGHLLTGSNFDDEDEKVTGGRNGLGAKLANIYSTEFKVECVDAERGKKFVQTFRNNMSERDKPSITAAKGKSSTKISFRPDLKRFGMEVLEPDMVALMTKRVWDIAGCNTSIKVSLNGEKLVVKSFQKYCDMFLNDPSKPKVFEQAGKRWEICFSVSNGDGFLQNSYVNSICTKNGGTHVKHVVDKIAKKVAECVKKKNRAAPVTTAQIKNHLWVFVNCLIVNPAFDGQPKHSLVTPSSKFGSKCELSDEFLKKILKCGVVEAILEFAKGRVNQALKKTGGVKKQRITGIAKLDDANDAGGRNAEQCTLILTEGDSAKTLAVSGLSVVGRDHYGVFPLRGKMLNVREATHKQIVENAEITSIKQIMGLKHGTDYSDTKSLRYGHLMIMTDQDHDGSHIKGLLINFIHCFWPSLLKIPGFLTEFITPIVKAKKGKQEMVFYTIPEYEKWKKDVIEERQEKGWTITYYKGLGTSTSQEAKQYFAAIEKHQIDFSWETEEDGDKIDMAFSKKRVEDRKEWIGGFKPGTDLELGMEELSYSDFIDKELIQFSIADCARSIPSVMDGLKPGQRKILFACFLKKLKEQIKVAQLSGYVALKSAYHHGEVSLQATIVNMAQNYVGANNINLLYPAGSFGSRLMGGKDAASPRYINTKLAKIARFIFPQDDDRVLNYLNDDGLSIEPQYYVPVLPMVLVNGAEGIGTGWSTTIPNYNPLDVVKNVRRLLADEPLEPMHPWYRGFKGTIEPQAVTAKKAVGGYKISGCWEEVDENTIDITELPIGMWTQTYKEMLEAMLVGSEKKPPVVKDYKEYHTDTVVHFRVEFLPGKLRELQKDDFEKKMKLSTTIQTSNMHCFDGEGRIKKYDTPEDIIREFYPIRLRYYEKRKQYLVDTLTQEWTKLDNKVRFILAVVKEEIIVRNRKRDDLLKELETKGFDQFDTSRAKKKQAEDEDEDEAAEPVKKEKKEKKRTGYDYLLSMPLWNLTMEKVQKLIKEREDKENELKVLIDTATKTLWERDLDAFIVALNEWYAEEEAIEQEGKSVKRTKGKRPTKARKPAARKKKDSDDEEDFETTPKKAPRTVKKEEKPTKPVVKKEEKPAKPVVKKEEKAAAKKPAATIETFFGKKGDPMDEDAPKKEAPKKEAPKKEAPKKLGSIRTSPTDPSAAKAPAKGGKKDLLSASISDDDDEVLSLTERIARKTGMDTESLSPEKKKPAPKKPAIDLSDSEDEKKPAPKKQEAKAPAKKKGVIESDDDEPAPTARARAPPRNAKKSAYVESDESEPSAGESDSDDFNEDD